MRAQTRGACVSSACPWPPKGLWEETKPRCGMDAWFSFSISKVCALPSTRLLSWKDRNAACSFRLGWTRVKSAHAMQPTLSDAVRTNRRDSYGIVKSQAELEVRPVSGSGPVPCPLSCKLVWTALVAESSSEP